MVCKKIVVLGTGGTIAGTATSASDNLTYSPAQIGVAQLLAAIPELGQLEPELLCEQLSQLNSKDMGFSVWQQLALRCAHWLAQDEVQGIVITHGTDTLEETAFFLHCVLLANKPVVLTCAMRPATSSQSDGPQNLIDALALVQVSGARGVLAVCGGTVHGAVAVQKIHPYRLNAFSSGEAGVLGFFEEGRFRQIHDWPTAAEHFVSGALEKIVQAADWPRVEVLLSYAGASGAVVDAMLSSTQGSALRGLVIAGTGNGNIHQDMEAAIGRAQAAGVRVLRASRCSEGRVLGKPGDLLLDSRGLSPVKARIALLLALL